MIAHQGDWSRGLTTIGLAAALCGWTLPASAATWFVDADAVGGDGTTWATAFSDLESALAVAVDGDDVWVAEGVYTPSEPFDLDASGEVDPREVTFRVPSGVAVYGGFDGSEGTLMERDWLVNVTVLSGDIDGNDDLSGYYLQAGYFLTGESRPYSGGKFKRPKPEGKGGAWEIVARYEDGDGNHSDIELGADDATAYTLGVNWYAHKNVKFGVNYTDGESNTSDDDGSEFRVRFQLTF